MRYFLLLLLPLLILSSCSSKYPSAKLGVNDPFDRTMVPSEFFTVDPDKDNVVEGASGTTVAMQKGCFVDRMGRAVSGPVRVELAEALTMDRMLSSNLTTTSDGKPLETGGMIYFKATAAGEEVFIKKSKPLYIEIPTGQKKGGMMVYHGIRDKDGNMNWIDPKPIETYLTPVDISTLDFLPRGFAGMVATSMPLGGYKKATKPFVDSLYYSFSTLGITAAATKEPEKRAREMGANAPLNEPYYNPNKKIEKGAYTKESYTTGNQALSDSSEASLSSDLGGEIDQNEIDPARIKTLKDPKFNNTLIATHEFEERLQSIFKTCDKDILDIYVNNLDKDLWRLDEMAAEKLGKGPMADQFRAFAAQRLTNVKEAPEQATAMQQYYQQQLAKNTQELKTLFENAEAKQAAAQRVSDSISDEYRKLLWQREKYRMEKYKFTWTDNGWVNIDKPADPVLNATIPDTVKNSLQFIKVEATVSTPLQYDHLHSYLVLTDVRSLYKMNAGDRTHYYVGDQSDHSMLMYPNKDALIVVVAYKDDVPYMAIKKFTTGRQTTIDIQGVTRTTPQDVGHVMNEIEKGNYAAKPGEWQPGKDEIAVSRRSNYLDENSMLVDIGYQRYFDAREDELERQQREQRILDHLRGIIHPCSICDNQGELSVGRSLFRSNCRSCHDLFVPTTGPELAGATSRHSRKWLYSFTRNWKTLYNAGDADAINWCNYAPSEMSVFPELTDKELKELYDYIECEGGKYVAAAPAMPQ
ncbi:MAG: cytochrome c [Bacteroidetes bacterium]|nr:cytochrome c [Bacteroidota bacterium]